MPLTVLVEEGKHASCPDRNGDGLYNPGYDTNLNIHDAWGTRDTFASSVVSARFDAAMQKIDRAHHTDKRVFPDLREDDPLRMRWRRQGHNGDGWGRTYDLLPALDPGVCASDNHCPHKAGAFGARALGGALADAYLVYSPFSRRFVGGRGSYVVALPLVTSDGLGLGPLRLKIPNLKYNAGIRLELVDPDASGARKVRADFLLSPSLARLSDWYIAVGKGDVRWEYEAGVRFRVKTNWFRDRFPLLGARVGLRSNGWSLAETRWVLEVGGGFF